jgi:hypothetical protein
MTLFGLITFGFVTKAVEFILVQRETEVFGSYYRSIGVLENIEDPQSGDISAGVDLIETSPYFAYGDHREIVSGIMAQSYNRNFHFSNSTEFKDVFPEDLWPNVHMTDLWFSGELIEKIEIMTQPENGRMVGYYLEFDLDTVLAGYPEYASEYTTLGVYILLAEHEDAIPIIAEMEVSQRYFMRGWENIGSGLNVSWDLPGDILLSTFLTLRPLDDEQLWHIPLEGEERIDFSNPSLAPIKDKIDVLNENLHTLGIITTVDMSAIPRMQEASRYFTLVEGRWLNHQDHLEGNKVIVVPEIFAKLRGFQLGDELQLTFRPLKDTFLGLIRDGVDALNWKSYPSYQETFKIVGIYARANANPSWYAYIPANSLRPGFTSATQDQFRWSADFSFVLDSSRHEAEFVQTYKEPLQELDISLTILENNGPAYWASVDPIRRSLSADLLVFGLLMVVALILAVFLYLRQRKRDYAILRALGVPTKGANTQLVLPLLLLGGLGIFVGGITAWNYAVDQAQTTLSTIPTPAGVVPSADLNPFILVGLCVVTFLLLALFSWLGALFLARRPVLALLQGQTVPGRGRAKQLKRTVSRAPMPIRSSGITSSPDLDEHTQPTIKTRSDGQRKYQPASLGSYVLRHMLRSRLKSFLTLAVALGFVLAAGWIRQTLERSRIEVDRLYDTTVVEAAILPTNTAERNLEEVGSGYVYRQTINQVLDSRFVTSSTLAADTVWFEIEKIDSEDKLPGRYPVYAYDRPEAFSTGLENPGSLVFAPGWDLERFARSRTLEELKDEGVPALFPTSLLEELQINVGERVRITNQLGTHTCVVVGQYSGWLVTILNSIKTSWINSGGHYILTPLSILESIEGKKIKYTVAHFMLDPEMNRDLLQFRTEMEEIMAIYEGNVRFVIWDEELRIVIDQLEQNISLIEVLYPVVIAVSGLVGAGLCFLLLLQTSCEAAILRVLGTTRTAVCLALVSEPLVLSIIGVAISLGIARFLWASAGLVPVGSLLFSAGLYLAGAVAGSVTGAIMITNKEPIALLQVKE